MHAFSVGTCVVLSLVTELVGKFSPVNSRYLYSYNMHTNVCIFTMGSLFAGEKAVTSSKRICSLAV